MVALRVELVMGCQLFFKVAIKPTPSISQVQSTINVKTKENTKLENYRKA